MIDTILLAVLVVLVSADLFISWNEARMAQTRSSLAWGQRQRLAQSFDGLSGMLASSLAGVAPALVSIGQSLGVISGKEDKLLAQIDDLKAAVAALQAADTAIGQSITGAANELQLLQQQLATLSAQETINPQDVENAAVAVQTVTTHLSTLVAALAAAEPPATPATPAPASTASSSAPASTAPASSAAPAAPAASGS
jgi:hypothetical protein